MMNHQWTLIVIFMASAVSGLLNYYGLNELAPAADWWLKSVFGLTAIVVTFSLSLFWQYAFNIVPELSLGLFRARGWLIVTFGVMMIVALSTYWNVVSLTKAEITRLGGNSIVAMAEYRIASATRGINGFLTFIGDVSTFGADTRDLQKQEIAGSGSGIPKAGPVSNTYGQVAKRLEAIVTSSSSARSNLQSLQTRISGCLADLSTDMNAGDDRQASQSVSCINQTLSQMAGLDVASTIKRGLSSLTSGVVVPVTIRTKAQRDTIKSFLKSNKARADKLANEIANRKRLELPEPLTLERPNILKGVLLYWKSLIPPIATALAIDLLPLVLLVFTALRYDDQNARNKPRHVWSANDLLDALQQARELELKFAGDQSRRDLPDYIDLEPVPQAKLDKTSDGSLSDDDSDDKDHKGGKE